MTFKPEINFISAVILLGVIQAFLLSLVFLKRDWRNAGRYVGFLTLVLGVIELESFLNYSGYFIYFPHITNLSPPLVLLIGPMIYFYIVKMVEPWRKIPFAILHFVPHFIYVSYSCLFFLQPAGFKIGAVMRSFFPNDSYEFVPQSFSIDPWDIQGIVVIEGLALHLLVYALLSVYVMMRHRACKITVQQMHWLRFFVATLCVGSIVFVMTGGVVNGEVLIKPVLPAYSIDLYAAFIVYGISFYWLQQGSLHQQPARKYAKSGIPEELRKQKLKLIQSLIEREKLFKDAGFSLQKLADKSSIPTHHISQVINVELNMTFADLINFYRIQEAKDILMTPQAKEMKMENLALELGYQSKSAFFTSFKKQTQTTPAKFRDAWHGAHEKEVLSDRIVPENLLKAG